MYKTVSLWDGSFMPLFYIAAWVLFLSGSALTLGTGFIFKLLMGTFTVSTGGTLGACAASGKIDTDITGQNILLVRNYSYDHSYHICYNFRKKGP